MERVDRLPVAGAERDVRRRAGLVASRVDPEVRAALVRGVADDLVALPGCPDAVAERLESLRVERLRGREVADVQAHVVDHPAPNATRSPASHGRLCRCPYRPSCWRS